MTLPLTENQVDTLAKLVSDRFELVLNNKCYVLFADPEKSRNAKFPDHHKAIDVDKCLLYITLFDTLVNSDLNEVDQLFRIIVAKAVSSITGNEQSPDGVATSDMQHMLKLRSEYSKEELEPHWGMVMFTHWLPYMHDVDIDSFA